MHIYKHYLTMLTQDHTSSVLCYSKAGLGKTYTTIKILKELKQEYEYISGITTAIALYKELHDTNGKILIIDDIETLFQDDRIINILKSALWEVDGKRIVGYKTSSKTLEDYPHKFEYTGKIIILANEIKGKHGDTFNALMSRCLKYKLTYTHNEIKEISQKILQDKKDLTTRQKQKIINIIDQTIKPQHNFNFRLLDRLIGFIKYSEENAQILFINSLDVDDDTQTLMKIIEENKGTETQIKEYMKQTGKSKMSYYRKKKKIQEDKNG